MFSKPPSEHQLVEHVLATVPAKPDSARHPQGSKYCRSRRLPDGVACTLTAYTVLVDICLSPCKMRQVTHKAKKHGGCAQTYQAASGPFVRFVQSHAIGLFPVRASGLSTSRHDSRSQACRSQGDGRAIGGPVSCIAWDCRVPRCNTLSCGSHYAAMLSSLEHQPEQSLTAKSAFPSGARAKMIPALLAEDMSMQQLLKVSAGRTAYRPDVSDRSLPTQSTAHLVAASYYQSGPDHCETSIPHFNRSTRSYDIPSSLASSPGSLACKPRYNLQSSGLILVGCEIAIKAFIA